MTCRSVKMEGSVTFNGEKLTKKIKKKVGYVLQGTILAPHQMALHGNI